MGTFTQLLLDTFYIEDCSEYYNIYAIPGYLCKLLPDGNVKWLKEVNKCNEQMKDMSLTGNIIYEAGEVYSWHDRGGLMKSFDASTGQEISSGGNGGCFEWCDASMNAVAADVLSPFTIGYASDDSPPSYPNLHYLYLNNNISCHENIYSSDIVHLSTGGFIICGRIDSSLILGKDSINAANGNVFVAKFNDPDPIPTNSISDNIVSETINIFPNPSYGKFTIESSEKKFVVEITSLTGKKIYFTKISTEKLEIDLSNQPKGIYFLEAMIGEERKIKKIIIE